MSVFQAFSAVGAFGFFGRLSLPIALWVVCSGPFCHAQRAVGDSLPLLLEDWRARFTLPNDGFMEVNLYLQWWNVLSLRFAGFDGPPRYDAFIRRGRLGTTGRITPRLFYNATFAYDGVGKDSLSAAAGVPNAEDNTTFFPRDVFLSYSAHPLFNLTVGYFRPRAGKESFYSSSFVVSQEKSWASFQPRFHLVGRGIGRETGINLGGLKNWSRFGLMYDVGLFDCNHPRIVGDNSIWTPLLTGRIVAFIGDPEVSEYTLTFYQSGYGRRKGLSIGANIGYQAHTQLFRDNTLTGVDAQLNYGPLDVLFEYNWLYRKNTLNTDGPLATTDRMLTFKVAWNVLMPNQTILQGNFMYSDEQADPLFTDKQNPFTGADAQWVIDIGVNYLLRRDRLKVGLHYFTGRKATFAPLDIYRYINASVQFMM